MKKSKARAIAPGVESAAVFKVMAAAAGGVKNWEKRSRLNPSLSKGAVFNILFDVIKSFKGKVLPLTVKQQVLVEFGDFYDKPKDSEKTYTPVILHQEPLIDEFKTFFGDDNP